MCDSLNINISPPCMRSPINHMQVDDVFLAPTIPVKRRPARLAQSKDAAYVWADIQNIRTRCNCAATEKAGRTACANVQFQGAGTAGLSVATC